MVEHNAIPAIVYREDAIERAKAIVNGTWSMHHNVMLNTEGGHDSRPQTLASIAQANAADVVALCALAPHLPSKLSPIKGEK